MSLITFKNNVTKQISDYTLRKFIEVSPENILERRTDFSVEVADLDFIPENGETVTIILTDLKITIEGKISQIVLQPNKKTLSIKIVSNCGKQKIND